METKKDSTISIPADIKLFVNDVHAAALIGLTPQTLRYLRFRQPGPPYHKLGRSVRYLVADLLAWVEKGRVVLEAC
jgi:hypothetical protein